MKYPFYEFVKTNFDGGDGRIDQGFDIITSCVDQVYPEESLEHCRLHQERIG